MSSEPWYPWYAADYANKTAHLSMVEHGAYRLLLDHYYQMGGKLKANEEQLLRVCRAFATVEKQALLSVLHQFFELRENVYYHDRADRELSKRAELSRKRAEIGQRGGAKAKAKRQAKGQANTEATDQANDKQLLTQSHLLSSSTKEESKARGRAGAAKAPASPAAQPGRAGDPGWEAAYPRWARVREQFGDVLWANSFAPCRPNGSETTLICVSLYDRDRLAERFGDKLERLFGEPVTFKVEPKGDGK